MGDYMHEYIRELEELIADVLVPVYVEHYRLLGRPNPINEINSKLLHAMSTRKKIPVLLQRQSYGK